MESKFVHKKQAKGNDNVEYGEVSVLHDTAQSEITLLPFYIKHLDPTKERDLRVKITKSKKVSGYPIAEYDINLTENLF